MHHGNSSWIVPVEETLQGCVWVENSKIPWIVKLIINENLRESSIKEIVNNNLREVKHKRGILKFSLNMSF